MTPIHSISLLPLPADKLEEASRLREQNFPTNSSSSSKLSYKHANPTLAAMSPMCRTGRYSAEEDSLVDKLIKSFDAGLLPLSHGIKLNVSNLRTVMCLFISKTSSNSTSASFVYSNSCASCSPVEQVDLQRS